MKIKILFMPEGREVEVDEGGPLLEAVCLADLGLDGDCGGRGSCGKCRVLAREGLTPLTSLEKKLLSSQDLEQGVRLACQAQVKGPAQVTLLATTAARHHILAEGISRAVRLQPALIKHFLPMGSDNWKKKAPWPA